MDSNIWTKGPYFKIWTTLKQKYKAELSIQTLNSSTQKLKPK